MFNSLQRTNIHEFDNICAANTQNITVWRKALQVALVIMVINLEIPSGQWRIRVGRVREAEVGFLARLYLFCVGLLEGKLHGGHSQLVGEEIHISRQLQRAHIGSRAVPAADATQQLPLTEREKFEEKQKQNSVVEKDKKNAWIN